MLPLFNFFRLQELMFAFTMFFAAGAAAVAGAGGGTGAGDGGASTGSGEGSADSSEGAGGDGSSSDQDGAGGEGESGELPAGQDGKQVDPNAAVDLGDGRTVPAKIKKLFDVAKTAGVEKEIRQLYFSNERLTKAIPGGVKGAVELANSVEQ